MGRPRPARGDRGSDGELEDLRPAVADLSAEDVIALGEPTGAVEALQRRAIAALRRTLSHEGGDVRLWGDGSEEVARRRPLDDSTADELIAGRTTASTDDLARVSAFLEELRALRDDPPPPPSPALSRMLAGDTEPVAGRGSRLVGDEPAGPWRAAPSNGTHRRTGAAAGPGRPTWAPGGAVAKAAVLALVTTATLTGAAAAGMLPGAAQQAVARAIETVTPFDLPAATGDGGGGGELMSRQGEPFDPAGGDRALTPADDADRQAGDGPADGTGSGGDDEATPDSTVTDDRSQRRAGPRPGAAVGGGATTVPSPPEPTPAWDPPSGAVAGPPPGGRTYTATLSGAAGPARPGDPDGTGRASVTVHSGRSLLCVALTTSGIAPATSVHLHRASAPSADPVVTVPAPAGDGRRECVPVDGEVLRRVRTDPGGHYVEVHNDEFPDGAVRGFLAP